MKPIASKNRALCIWLPHWPLQRIIATRQGRSNYSLSLGERVGVRVPARELLLYEQFRRGLFRVVACSGRFGIRTGMSLAEATALGNIECQEHDPLADRTALLQLAGWCEQFGPIVGVEDPDNLLVDVTGLGSLFGGEERLAEQVMRAFQRLGLTVRVAIADTVGAAWAIRIWRKNCQSSFRREIRHPCWPIYRSPRCGSRRR